jgi:hypothetical protein
MGRHTRATATLIVAGLLFLAACGRQGQFELQDHFFDSTYTQFGRD